MPIYKQKEKKDGLFKYLVRINYTDSFGKHKQLTRTAWGLQEAKDLEIKLMNEVNDKNLVKNMTLDDLFEEYIEAVQHDVRYTSLLQKEKVYNAHVQPMLGKTKLKSLSVKLLTQWKNSINDKGYALSYRKNIYSVFHRLLNYAVKLEYMPSNPLSRVGDFKDAGTQVKEMVFYTPEEFQLFKQELLKSAEEKGFYDFYVFFMIAYYTGARKGEIHALRWKSLKDNYMIINKSLKQNVKGPYIETAPKNRSSIRTIQMPQPLIDALAEHKSRQQADIPNWNEDGFICGYYRPIGNMRIRRERDHCADRAGIKRIRVHDFRHSHASLLINSNINPLEVAHRLGHSNVNLTLSTYSHLFPTESEKSIAILNNII